MGQQKQKVRRRQELLKGHPPCIYCGDLATTTDHCPPRCFFERRLWPETYEFTACEKCNDEARLDEQALAVLARAKLTEISSEIAQQEWQRLVQGVRNNQPKFLAEWTEMSRNEIKSDLRSTFGREQGDLLRRKGWGLIKVGPLTEAAIKRFMIKLGKALYYRHNEHIFDGVLYVRHINAVARDTTPEFLGSILKIAPTLAVTERNRKPLSDQFIYRFNYSPEHRAMYAVTQFGQQLIFQIIAVSREMDSMLLEQSRGADLTNVRFECFLREKPAIV
jgi:hypothetical protein